MALGRALKEVVEDGDLGRTFGQQQLGRCRTDQAGAADDQETMALDGEGLLLGRLRIAARAHG